MVGGNDLWGRADSGSDGAVGRFVSGRIQAAAFGASPGATAVKNTDSIQAAIDYAESLGGGVVELDVGAFAITQTALDETWGLGGVAANTQCCLALRPHVKLVGQGRTRTKLTHYEDAHYSMIAVLSADGSAIRELSLDGCFVDEITTPGAGHGIITIPKSDALADWIVRDFTVEDVGISNIASYGIGIEFGAMTRVLLKDIWTYNTGADAIDTKDGNGDPWAPVVIWPVVQCKMKNLHLQRWARRVGGGNPSAIDINGPWMVEDVWAIDESRVDVPTRGIRTDGADAISIGGRRCEIHNFHVTYQGAAPDFPCLVIRVPGVVVSGGICEGGAIGIQFGGNITAQPDYANVSSVTCIDQTTASVRQESTSAVYITMNQIVAVNAPVGFDLDGVNTTLSNSAAINCATPLIVEPSARQSIQLIGNHLGSNIAHRLGGHLAVGNFDNFDDPGSAQARLIVGQNITGSATPNGEVILGHNFASTIGGVLGQVSFYSSDETVNAKGIQAAIRAVTAAAPADGTAAELVFATGNGAQNGSVEKMRLTAGGLIPPKLTTAERDGIVSPIAGLVIYNTTTNLLNFYNGAVWGVV